MAQDIGSSLMRFDKLYIEFTHNFKDIFVSLVLHLLGKH